jgi:hypothetical protein
MVTRLVSASTRRSRARQHIGSEAEPPSVLGGLGGASLAILASCASTNEHTVTVFVKKLAARPSSLVFLGAALLWLGWLLQLPLRFNAWMVFGSGLPLLALGSYAAAQARHSSWRGFVGRTADVHAVLVVLLFALGVQIEDAHGVTTDGVIYFTQLRSVLFDGDLDVAREFAFLGQPARPAHVVPIGPIPVWLPLYLAVAAADALGRAIGWWAAPADSVATGLTTPYVRAVLISSFAVGAAGLLVLHTMLRREFGRIPALAATLLLLGATSLFWYLVYEPAMTHAVSFGFVAFFVVATAHLDPRNATNRQLALAGFLLGLAFITRPQEAVFVLLPAVSIAALQASVQEKLRAAVRYAAWGLVGFAPLLLLQLVHSYVLFNRERLVLVGGEEGFVNPFASRWSETLFSSWHGFFSWTPLAYVAFLGTLAYGRRRWDWAVASAMIVFAMAWINGSTPDLGAGWSFGGRRFVSCLVLLAPGLALIAHSLLARPMIAVGALSALAIAWNVLLMEQLGAGALPRREAVGFDRIVRGQATVATKPPYFYPFAFPANVIFSWRTGLPIDAYDLLGHEPLHSAIDLALEGHTGRFLVDGWGAPTGDDSGAAWWIAGSPATMVLPLRLPDDRPILFEVRARTRLADPPRAVPMSVVINGREIGTFAPESMQASTGRFETAKRDVWIDGFNRVAFVTPTPVWPIAIYRIAVRAAGP